MRDTDLNSIQTCDSKNIVKEELIPLNLIFTYPVSWSEFKVLRDFIQNFYDAVGGDEWVDRFSYRTEGESLVMEASDVSFSHDWLIHIGASTKQNTRGRYAGYFGEGFKIASLCALRDHGWEVVMMSRDWELEVTTTQIKVDNTNLQSLAYRLRRKKSSLPDSILILRRFSQKSMQTVENAVLSFFYRGNPLVGKEIWSSESGSICYRSKTPKPPGYPSTSDCSGNGIIFANFQALGSHPYDLVFCVHDYSFRDRERNFFFKMDVVEIVRSLSHRISPEAAFEVLGVLKDRWYDYPKKRYDFESWYKIVHELARIVGTCPELAEKWRAAFPNLLVARQVKPSDLPRKNRRTEALAWLKRQRKKYKLVQDGFLHLDYPELESLCEENDGFNVTREPTEGESKYIAVLEEAVLTVFEDFLGEETLPPCRVIEGSGGAWAGMTSCVSLSKPVETSSGNRIKYRLPYVALRQYLFRPARFGEALSTYLHELGHCFGGDKSATFSHVVTAFLERAITHARDLETFSLIWEGINADVGE